MSRSAILAAAMAFLRFSGVDAAPAAHRYFRVLDAEPNLPTDASTTPYCTWWVDYSGGETCAQLISDNFVSMTDFYRWNPVVKSDCSGLKSGFSYCVEALNEPPPSSSSKPSSSTKVSTPPPSTTPKPTSTPSTPTITTPPVTSSTKAPNGIETPLPTQPDIVGNCDKFYLVQKDEGCSAIAAKFGITLAQFQAWNPKVGTTCGGLWADAYACVSIIGHEASSTPSTPTTTKPGNGISTPQPTQPNMVSNCDKFHFVVQDKDNCATIAAQYGISLAQFQAWNPSAGAQCGGLWANAYCCVSIIGQDSTPTPTAKPTTTKPGNGVATPTPTQPGMVSNCKKFDYVKKGEVCDTIVKRNSGLTLTNFYKWNTGVGKNCELLWAETYVCIAIL
ncbi:hypothetical protein BDV96DRAFT_556005 [Lophiotrema nucula]|uniref:LysM domain-containing protein n=1 Tax=Lophiotrema nucula TaxID=690887 RepID=A0A6A5YN78_9PLEO|nr:hypothetical protein BDV96DRAFT_556005 [Lophiotrema nucula]